MSKRDQGPPEGEIPPFDSEEFRQKAGDAIAAQLERLNCPHKTPITETMPVKWCPGCFTVLKAGERALMTKGSVVTDVTLEEPMPPEACPACGEEGWSAPDPYWYECETDDCRVGKYFKREED